MELGLYANASAMLALERWQDNISHNLASAQVSGYQANNVAFQGFLAGALEFDDPRLRLDTISEGVLPVSMSQRNINMGAIRPTGSPTDFAINGPGYFQLVAPDGRTSFTRNGEFYFNEENTLVNFQGQTVQGVNGAIIRIPGEGEVTFGRDGTVNQGVNVIGVIAVYEFADPQGLERREGSRFVPTELSGDPEMALSPTVLSGFLEGSNVNVMQEMVDMIQVSRAYEMNMKMIQNFDDLTGKMITSLTT